MTVAQSRSKKASNVFAYSSKDGFHYRTYSAMREANVAYNQGHLKKLGLEKAGSSLRRQYSKKRASPSTRSKATPQRRSSRVRNVSPRTPAVEDPEQFVMLKTPLKPKQKYPPKHQPAPVTPEDRRKLENLPDWTDAMEHYLRHEEHLSQQNHRSVMRQVKRLVAGVGITYSRWKKDTWFMRGTKVDLSWDFGSLFQDAVAFENENGRDLGNGWLLRHPIKKLGNFQSYYSMNTKKNLLFKV